MEPYSARIRSSLSNGLSSLARMNVPILFPPPINGMMVVNPFTNRFLFSDGNAEYTLSISIFEDVSLILDK